MNPSRTPTALTLLFLAGLLLLSWYMRDTLLLYSGLLHHTGLWGYLAYILLLATAVVVMPLSVMPLIPVAAMTFGPLPTAILSIIGWTLGAVSAFLIARHLGRPFVTRFMKLEALDSIASMVPKKMRFWWIVLLRHALPVDVVSYALGLTSTIHLWEFTAATIIGVIWFSFAFAYLGEALLTGKALLIVELGALSLLIFAVAWKLVRRHHTDK